MFLGGYKSETLVENGFTHSSKSWLFLVFITPWKTYQKIS